MDRAARIADPRSVSSRGEGLNVMGDTSEPEAARRLGCILGDG